MTQIVIVRDSCVYGIQESVFISFQMFFFVMTVNGKKYFCVPHVICNSAECSSWGLGINILRVMLFVYHEKYCRNKFFRNMELYHSYSTVMLLIQYFIHVHIVFLICVILKYVSPTHSMCLCVFVYLMIQRVWNKGCFPHCPRHHHHLGDGGFLSVPSRFWFGSS